MMSEQLKRQKQILFSRKTKKQLDNDQTELSKLNALDIIEQIKTSSQIDIELINLLCNVLFYKVDEKEIGSTPVLFYTLSLKEWVITQKAYSLDIIVKRNDMIMLARGHTKYWLNECMKANKYHLERAKILYANYIQLFEEYTTAKDLVDYGKVLMFLGDKSEACKVISSAINNYESDKELANYLFYAGAILKSNQEHEKANNFLFEANQNGPPRFFTKIEMMIVISRNLEEMNDMEDAQFLNDFDNGIDNSDDAYQVVHAHLIREGYLEGSITYDDWISDAKTWLAIADKCAMHHMYSLATDFYSLAILKDPDAFRKPMLWFRFAKACYRCGRISDAQLGLIQAISKDPFNSQLIRSHGYLHHENQDFQQLVKKGVDKILELITSNLYKLQSNSLQRLQAFVKGGLERSDILLGLGHKKVIEYVDSKPQKMKASIGISIKLKSSTDNDLNNLSLVTSKNYLIQANCSWMGKLSYLNIFDINTNIKTKLKLKHPFSPIRESGQPRQLTFSLVPCYDSDISNEDIISKDYVEILLKFNDYKFSYYSYRKIRLLFNGDNIDIVDISIAEQREFLKLPPLLALDKMIYKDSLSFEFEDLKSILSDSIEMKNEDLDFIHQKTNFYLADYNANAVSITNLQSVVILREGFCWKSKSYLVRVVNDLAFTQISMMQVNSNKSISIFLLREHIDRSLNLYKCWCHIMSIIEDIPNINTFLNDENNFKLDSIKLTNEPYSCNGIYCYVKPDLNKKILFITLVNSYRIPIIGSAFEIFTGKNIALKRKSIYSSVISSSKVKETEIVIDNVDDEIQLLMKGSALDEDSLSCVVAESIEEEHSSTRSMEEEQVIIDIDVEGITKDNDDIYDNQETNIEIKVQDEIDLAEIESVNEYKQVELTIIIIVSTAVVFTSQCLAISMNKVALLMNTSMLSHLKNVRIPISTEVYTGSNRKTSLGMIFSVAQLRAKKNNAVIANLRRKTTAFLNKSYDVGTSKFNRGSTPFTVIDKVFIPISKPFYEEINLELIKLNNLPVDSDESDDELEQNSFFEDLYEDVIDKFSSIYIDQLIVEEAIKIEMEREIINNDLIITIVDELLDFWIYEDMKRIVKIQLHHVRAQDMLNKKKEAEEIFSTFLQNTIWDEVCTSVLDKMVTDIAFHTARTYNRIKIKNAYRDSSNENENIERKSYFVKKIRSRVQVPSSQTSSIAWDDTYETDYFENDLEIMPGMISLNNQSSLILKRDSFTPALPSNLLDINLKVAKSHHMQISTTGASLEDGTSDVITAIISAQESQSSYFDQSIYRESDNLINVLVHHKSAAVVSKHNRSVQASHRAQNQLANPDRNNLFLGNNLSQSFFSTSEVSPSNIIGTAHDETDDELAIFAVPVSESDPGFTFSTMNTRIQSPSYPAAALPSYALDSADGLKAALRENWDKTTIHKYWDNALKLRASERIDNPFAAPSISIQKRRAELKAKAARAHEATTPQAIAKRSEQFKTLQNNKNIPSWHPGMNDFKNSFFSDTFDTYQSLNLDNNSVGCLDSRPQTAPVPRNALKGSDKTATRAKLSSSSLSVTRQSSTNKSNPSNKPAPALNAHSHDYDESNLLSNQLEKPFRNMGMRVSCRSPADLSIHFKRSTAALAEAVDEAASREIIDNVFRESLEVFDQLGYISERPLVHASHWFRKLSDYLVSLKSGEELRKRLALLHRTSPIDIHTDEAICGLADTAGSIGELIQKLNKFEYIAELRLVCRSIHVENMVDTILHENSNIFEKSEILINKSQTDDIVGTNIGYKRTSCIINDAILHQASFVTNPFGYGVAEHHHEVIAHREMRDKIDQLTLAKDLKRFGLFSTTTNTTDSLQCEGLQSTINTKTITKSESNKELTKKRMSKSGLDDINNVGLFLPSIRNQLNQDSPFVLGRASIVTLTPLDTTTTNKNKDSNLDDIQVLDIMNHNDSNSNITSTQRKRSLIVHSSSLRTNIVEKNRKVSLLSMEELKSKYSKDTNISKHNSINDETNNLITKNNNNDDANDNQNMKHILTNLNQKEASLDIEETLMIQSTVKQFYSAINNNLNNNHINNSNIINNSPKDKNNLSLDNNKLDSNTNQSPQKRKNSSYLSIRINEIIDNNIINKPFTLLSEKDALDAMNEQSLLQSNKLFIREPIQKKANKILKLKNEEIF